MKIKMKSKTSGKIIRMVWLVGAFIIFSSFASAANIGISPAKIYFEDVLRGGHSEKIVTITIDSEEPTEVSIIPRGEIETWLNFSEETFVVSKDNPYYLKIIVEPDEDIPNGNYSGFLRVKISGTSETIEGHATSVIQAALDLSIEVEITDVEYSECKASKFSVESAEIGDPIIFKMEIYNRGNIRMNPRISIDIWDQNQIEILKHVEYSNKEIIPTTEEELVIEVDSNQFELGQYWAEVSAIDCYNTQTLTFDVLEIGALKSSGILLSVATPPWINVDDTTIIEATFNNNGEKQSKAQFKGEITLGNKIIQILESEEAWVGIGESNTFKFYFTPKTPGKYIVNGRVFYDGKRTYEKSAVINVRESGFKIKSLKMPLIYLVLIIAIAFLMYRINKEKKEHWKKMRKYRK